MGKKKTIAIIGGGSAALAFASFTDTDLFDVTIYDKNATLGRKFLVAGKGGFNLSHSEDLEEMKTRYTPLGFMDNVLTSFSNNDLRDWFGSIGIETYVGSSGRIFPIKGTKPIAVLDAILDRLKEKGVAIKTKMNWTGWTDDNRLKFNDTDVIQADYSVFCLGGGSWKVTGSDGSWLPLFDSKGINVLPFLPANCAYGVNWSQKFIDAYHGKPLKNVSISCDGACKKGEVVITKFGLEGNAIYSLTNQIQKGLSTEGKAKIFIDLKPVFTEAVILSRILTSTKKRTEALRHDLNLDNTKIQLLKSTLSKDQFLDNEVLVTMIKSLPIVINDAANIDTAISTTGGVDLDSINENFELKSLQNTFAIGEMLDWNAPTGGYLLQACFSMGWFLAKELNGRG